MIVGCTVWFFGCADDKTPTMAGPGGPSIHTPADSGADAPSPGNFDAAIADAKGGASLESCGAADGGIPISRSSPTGQEAGFLPGRAGPFRGSCGGSTGGEIIYAVDVTRSLQTLDIDVIEGDNTAEVALYVRSSCADASTELACNMGKAARVSLPNPIVGRYFVFVDGAEARSEPFRLLLRGTVPRDAACDVGSEQFHCAAGLRCLARGSEPAACVPAACGDGVDNDGDGKTDFPNEPGCTTLLDDDETDPATPPECADGLDNDGDGRADHPADPGCEAASDSSEIDSCVEGLLVDDISLTGTAMGTTIGAMNHLVPSCDDLADGGERAFRFNLPAAASQLDVKLTDRFSGARISVRRDECASAAAEVACATFEDSVTVMPAPAGRYYVIIDTGFGEGGPFTLEVTARLDAGGACDPASTTVTCAAGLVCGTAGTGRVCRKAACSDTMDNDGDGKTDFPAEPGCTSAEDDDESDPAAAPICANGIDDDMDGSTDWPADIGCVSASGDTEAAPCGAAVVTDITSTGSAMADTTGAPEGFVPMCSSTATRGERVYAYQLPAGAQSLKARLAQDFAGSVLHVRRGDCRTAASEVACSSSPEVTVAPAPAGTYFIFVDSDYGNGAFTLDVQARLAAGSACTPMSPTATCADGLLCRAAGMMMPTTCQRPSCSNGMDDDLDGITDFPADPGCASAADDDETNPATAPVCANGIDDDMDGLTDYPADPGCLGAGSDSEAAICGAGVVVEDITATGMAMGTTTALPSAFAPSMCGTLTANTAGERVFTYRLAAPGNLRFSTDSPMTNFDTVLYVRRDACMSAEIACNDDGVGATTSLTSTAILRDQPAGVYFVFVDGYGARAGNFVLTATLVP
jgi:hypothetical protein